MRDNTQGQIGRDRAGVCEPLAERRWHVHRTPFHLFRRQATMARRLRTGRLRLDDFPPGDFTAVLHIISPLIPLLSIGKRPNLRPFLPAIDTALRRAFIKSRKRLPPHMAAIDTALRRAFIKSAQAAAAGYGGTEGTAAAEGRRSPCPAPIRRETLLNQGFRNTLRR